MPVSANIYRGQSQPQHQQPSNQPPSDNSHGEASTRYMSKEDADRLYMERMEEEYAKREGGA